jgi:diguanylate cyclase (GGDEF)-like protein
MLTQVISVYLFAAVLLTAFFAAYVFSKAHSSYLRSFFALCICVSVYLLGYLLELNNTSIQQMIFWNQIQYITLPFFPALWLLVALLYARRVFLVQKWQIILLLLVPAATFIIRLTNPWHLLYYRSFSIRENLGLSLLYLEKGPWYWVHSGFAVAAIFLTILLFYLNYRNSARIDRRQMTLLLLASLLPMLGLIFILLDPRQLGLDYTALTVPVSLGLILHVVVRYDFLEARSLARDRVFEESADAMILLDLNMRILDYNKAALRIFPELDERRLYHSLDALFTDRPELLSRFGFHSPQSLAVGSGEDIVYYDLVSTFMKDHNGRYAGILKTMHEVTEKKKLEDKMRQLATIDSLSGLDNRRHFIEQAEQAWLYALRYEHDISLLMIDIDHFKRINDTYGHALGDQVIHRFGAFLRGRLRETDFCGRLGGEEFAVLLPNTNRQDALRLAEELRLSVAEEKPGLADTACPLTISIGVAGGFDQAQTLEGLLDQADRALYQAKRLGRNQTVLAK